VELGRWFSELTGTVGSTRMAVTFQVYEVHPSTPSEAWRQLSRGYFRRGLARPRVGVGITTIDVSTGKVWSNFPGLVRFSHVTLLGRAFNERSMTEDRRRALLAKTGLQARPALMGIALGATAAIGGTSLLLSMRVSQGDLYAGMALVSCVLAVIVSVKSCRICRRTIEQALVAGLGAYAVVVGNWWRVHIPIGLHTALLGLIVAAGCFTVGLVANPRRR
jgi:hypothetical protein